MNKLIFFLALISISAFSQSNSAIQKFQLSPSESKVIWKGKDFTGTGSHEGTLQLTSGYLMILNDETVKGEFELDMRSIKNTDQKDEQGRRDLEEHLRSEDFFEVAKYPKAFFSITKIEPIPFKVPYKADRYTVTGFLGIKGITNAITFTSVITLNNNIARAQANITFDRTKWNVNYQSKTIFANLKDGILSDNIEVSLDLVFRTKETRND